MERLRSTGFWIGPIDIVLSGEHSAVVVAAAARWLQRRSHAAAR